MVASSPFFTITNQTSNPTESSDDLLEIAGRKFRSRLMTGSGKYANFEIMRQAIAVSGCEIVTVAVRRVQTNAAGHEGFAGQTIPASHGGRSPGRSSPCGRAAALRSDR